MARHPASGLTRTLGLAAGAGLLLSAAARWARRIDLKGRGVVVTGGAQGWGSPLPARSSSGAAGWPSAGATATRWPRPYRLCGAKVPTSSAWPVP